MILNNLDWFEVVWNGYRIVLKKLKSLSTSIPNTLKPTQTIYNMSVILLLIDIKTIFIKKTSKT